MKKSWLPIRERMPVCCPVLLQKRLTKNLRGLQGYDAWQHSVSERYRGANRRYQGLEKTRYVNDKQITDHYAIIPTGQGLGALARL